MCGSRDIVSTNTASRQYSDKNIVSPVQQKTMAAIFRQLHAAQAVDGPHQPVAFWLPATLRSKVGDCVESLDSFADLMLV